MDSGFRRNDKLGACRFWPRAVLGLCLAVLLVFPTQAAEKVPGSELEIKLSFAPLVKAAAPAVVNIYTKRVVEARGGSPLFDDPFFKHFFGEGFGFGQPSKRIQNSLGSGVIVRPDGLIVTNHHVVKDSDEITVVLGDGREFEARIVAREEKVDLALLRVKSDKPLPALAFGDSDDLEVGDLVLAIGNPFGVGQTVTSGIVSAVARTHVGIGDFGFFIQTDAAINPGNSGGALIDMQGRLAGINTAIFSRTGGSIGIGFAIPSNMVAAVVAAEASGGHLVRPWLGLDGQALTAELAEGLGLDRPGGVVISSIFQGGPADRAGLQRGDIVVAVNGREVRDPQGLRFRLATLPIGDTAALTALRRGRAMEVNFELVAAPEVPPRQETPLEGRHALTGATVANLSPAVAEEMGVMGAWEGVVITAIKRGSYARRAGFEPGDVVLRINGEDIGDVAGLLKAVAESKDRWEVSLRRGGEVITLVLG